MSVATRINIDEEFKARDRGECLCCRIGATHDYSGECVQTPAFKGMTLCTEGHVYDQTRFDSCPDCKEA